MKSRKLDEWEPLVMYQGKVWYYIDKKGLTYTLRPTQDGNPIKDRTQDVKAHLSELRDHRDPDCLIHI